MEAAYNLNRNRRINGRKKFNKEAIFSTKSIFFTGKIDNISIEGATVRSRTVPKIKTGMELLLAIPFDKKQGYIKRKAIVIWVKNEMFGIKFNKRINERKNCQKEVFISTGSMNFSGKIENISLGGAHIGSRNISIIKTPIVITVSIPFTKKQSCMKRKAIVRWAKNDQFGIQFI